MENQKRKEKRFSHKKKAEGDRTIFVHGENGVTYEPEVKYRDNYIITSQYTWYNFLPVNLFQQFLNLANLYFLIIGALQIISQISTTNGNPTMYQPLFFIVFVSATRAAKEDWDKHRSDAARNGYCYEVIRHGHLKNVKSGDLKVGDIIKVKQNDMVPADMIILGSSIPQGHCYIDKANLNGETTLEVVSSIPETRWYCEKEENLKKIDFELTYEPPNKRFDTFRGTLTIKKDPVASISLNGKVLLMRETNLKNCTWIYGLIVYTGNDTKIQMSNLDGEKAPMKKSKIMKQVEKYLKGMLLIEVILCIIASIYTRIWLSKEGNNMWFLELSSDPNYTGFLAYFTWFIILSQMVPISLIVSSEMVKFAQSKFMQWDIGMFYGPINKTAKCNSSTIHEDLGLIDYIFSDKTGTLTQNKMTFRYCLLPNGEYGSKDTEISKAVRIRNEELEGKKKLGDKYVHRPPTKWTKLSKPHLTKPPEGKRDADCCETNFTNFYINCWGVPAEIKDLNDDEEEEKLPVAAVMFSDEDKRLLLKTLWADERTGPALDAEEKEDGRNVSQWKERQMQLRRFLTHMALSNTVKPYEKDGLKFQSESAEELAMVTFARDMGFTKKQQNPTVLEIQKYSPDLKPLEKIYETYNHVATLGFTSQRARVTVIYQRTENLPPSPISSNSTGSKPEIVFNSSPKSTPLSSSRDLTNSDSIPRTPLLLGKTSSKDSTKDIAINGISSMNSSNNLELPLSPALSKQQSSSSKQLGSIYIMTKGQDTVIMPFLKTLTGTSEVTLLKHLKDMCANGLRTLVCAFSDKEGEWWVQREKKYMEAVQRDPSKYSEGHPDKCSKSDDCEKCCQHQLFEEMEQEAELNYLGCTGLEDQLQPLVPECIQDCLRAGIKVWMITGDKLETAKNIGLACNLIDADMQPHFEDTTDVEGLIKEFKEARLLEITGQWASLGQNVGELHKLFESFDTNKDGLIEAKELLVFFDALDFTIGDHKEEERHIHSESKCIESVIKQYGKEGKLNKTQFVEMMQSTKLTMYDAVRYDIREGIRRYHSIKDHVTYPVSILVNRDAFLLMFPGKKTDKQKIDERLPTEEELEKLRQDFFHLAAVSKSVVFARAEPSMKKRMVTEIQARVSGAITLAIGDGANDTDMITAAHIGVGIAGVEGTAATNASDYAIGTFRMLHNLLFVHGFWSYQRIATLVNFIFYKACMVAITMYYFGFFSGFSGQQFFNDYPYQVYNVVFTSIPIIITAVLDQNLPYNLLQNTPQAYQQQKGNCFNSRIFISWVVRAFLHSCIIFFVTYGGLGYQNVADSRGYTHDLWYMSTVSFICVALVPSGMILFEMNSWTLLHIMVVILSIIALFFTLYVLNVLPTYNPDLYGVVNEIYSSPQCWLTIILVCAIPLLFEFGYRAIKRSFVPTYTEVLQEIFFRAKKDAKNEVKEKEKISTPRDAAIYVQSKALAHAVPHANPDSNKHTLKKKVRAEKALEERTTTGLSISDTSGVSAALIRAMLRFRNLTGSQFDSAATARTQQHDNFRNDLNRSQKSHDKPSDDQQLDMKQDDYKEKDDMKRNKKNKT